MVGGGWVKSYLRSRFARLVPSMRRLTHLSLVSSLFSHLPLSHFSSLIALLHFPRISSSIVGRWELEVEEGLTGKLGAQGREVSKANSVFQQGWNIGREDGDCDRKSAEKRREVCEAGEVQTADARTCSENKANNNLERATREWAFAKTRFEESDKEILRMTRKKKTATGTFL